MRRDDWETPTPDAADAFERSHAPTAYDDALEHGYDPTDDTLGTHLPLTDPAAFERACHGARAMRAAAEERDRAWRAAREAS